jgi:serine/threonine protein kinase
MDGTYIFLPPWLLMRSSIVRWPSQAVEALRYIHSRGVIHCDIGVGNFLISNEGSLVLADFCGSRLDGSEPLVKPLAKYSRPVYLKKGSLAQPEKDDIFALGTVLYEINVGHKLYARKSNAEIYSLFQKREFPDIRSLPENIRGIVRKCWNDGYSNA